MILISQIVRLWVYFLLLLQKKVPKKSSPGNLFAKRFPETLPKGRGIFAEDAKMRGPIMLRWKTRLPVLTHTAGLLQILVFPRFLLSVTYLSEGMKYGAPLDGLTDRRDIAVDVRF